MCCSFFCKNINNNFVKCNSLPDEGFLKIYSEHGIDCQVIGLSAFFPGGLGDLVVDSSPADCLCNTTNTLVCLIERHRTQAAVLSHPTPLGKEF